MKQMLAMLLPLILCACATQKTDSSTKVRETSSQKLSVPKSSIVALTDEYVQESLKLDPFWAPAYGDEKFYTDFGDPLSDENIAKSKKLVEVYLKRLHSISKKAFSEFDKDTFKIFEDDLKTAQAGFKFPFEQMPFNQMSSRFRDFVKQGNGERYPFKTVKNYEDFLKRASGFKIWVESAKRQMRKGMSHGVTLNKDIALTVIKQLKDYVVSDITKSDFYQPIVNLPQDFSSADKTRLKDLYAVAIATEIIPQYKALSDFMENEYLPKTRRSFGLYGLPNANAWYQYKIKEQADVDWSPKQIHQIGLEEVARIRKGLEQAKKELEFKGSFVEFLKYLTTDKFNFKNKEEVKAAFLQTKLKIQNEIPKYFSRLPKLDYEILEIPANEASQQAAAHYRQHDETSSPAVFINSNNLKSIPTWEVANLSLHEAIPGHHFQIEIQYELKDLISQYRVNSGGSNAFVEGWALYCESLGYDFGLFGETLSRIGNLDDDMLRSVRLVVDTGIHSMGWSKDRAVKYMQDNLADDISDIEAEVYRYSSWPGQALAYKIGQRKILELRSLAKKKLRKKFDIREFHNVVIGGGSLPLWLLDSKVKDWVKKRSLVGIPNFQ